MNKPISTIEYHKFYIETAVQRILEVLYKYPDKEFSLSDLAKLAKVSKSDIGAIIANLVDYKYLEVEKLTKIWRIRAKKTSRTFIKGKIIYNLNFIYQSGVIEFLYEHYKHPKSITLFGSFRKGEDISGSDIDIAVESDEFKEYNVTGLRGLVEFEKSIGRKIQIHEFSRKNVDINVFNNIANGVVLAGFLEVRI